MIPAARKTIGMEIGSLPSRRGRRAAARVITPIAANRRVSSVNFNAAVGSKRRRLGDAGDLNGHGRIVAVGDAGEEGIGDACGGFGCGSMPVGADPGGEGLSGAVAVHVDPVQAGGGAGDQRGDELGGLGEWPWVWFRFLWEDESCPVSSRRSSGSVRSGCLALTCRPVQQRRPDRLAERAVT